MSDTTPATATGAVGAVSALQDAPEPEGSLLSLGDDELLARLGGDPGEPAPDESTAGDEPSAAVEDEPAAAPEDDEPATDEPGAEGEPEAGAASGKAPATFFKLQTGDGEQVEYDPDVLITYRKNGKEVSETLEQVVRNAAGRAGQEAREVEEVRELRDYRQRAEEIIPRVKARMDELLEENERLIADDDYRTRKREEWAESNTPEKVNERLRAENDRLKQQQRIEAERVEATRFLNEDLSPALEALAQRYPHVESQEIVDRYASLVRHLEGADRRIPPSAFRDCLRAVTEQLEPWVKARHEKIAGMIGSATASVSKEADKKVSAAQVKATLARRTLTRPMRGAPVRAGAPKPGPSPTRSDASGKPARHRTVDDALDDLTDRLVADVT